jgi:hypothetical protein
MIERLLAGKEQMMADREAEQENEEADREHKQQTTAEIKAFREKTRSIIKVHREGMKAIFGADHGKTEATDPNHNPGKTEASLECEQPSSVNMESEAEHRMVPKEDSALTSVGGLRKRRTAGRRKKPKEGFRRKLATVRRGTTCRAKVAWRKGIISRNKWTSPRLSWQPGE